MSEQTTQLINESSTIDTMRLSEAYLRLQIYWESPPDDQLTMYKYIREISSSWLVPYSESMSLTLPEIVSHVADNPSTEILLSTSQLLDRSINQRLWESLAEYLSRGVIGFRVKLTQALEELDQVVDEAQSEGYEIPSRIAIDNAEYILKRIYDNLLHSFQVYPMPDGQVAIDVTNGDRSSVLILCCSDGRTLCFVNINGNQRRAHYSNSDTLPDGFMCEALEELLQK